MSEQAKALPLKLILPALLLAAGILVWLLLPSSPAQQFRNYSEHYLALALSLEQFQEGEVDSYFGPDSISGRDLPLATIQSEAEQLLTRVNELQLDSPGGADLLASRLRQLINVAEFLQDPEQLSFAEETGLLFGLKLAELPERTRLDERGRVEIISRPPTEADQAREAIIEELNTLLPGTGSLPFRVASFQTRHQVPLDRREEVFERALAACREAATAHWTLPANEALAVEWTRDVSSPWHRYQGNGQSLLQINPLTLGYIGSMIDVACHEGYPGHHAQFLLLDDAATDSLPLAEQLTLLRSPQAVLREAAAEYAVDLAMPWSQRLAFERDVLFPMAGLASDEIGTYARIHELVTSLGFATIPTLQEYADGELPLMAASLRLERDALVASPKGLLDFVDQFGAYAVGYTLAEQALTSFIASQPSSQSETEREKKWRVLADIMSRPTAMSEPVLISLPEPTPVSDQGPI
ncbi:MAG: hypothetical protein PsegKO_09780 [Pseudohongiellaceae bacterium]